MDTISNGMSDEYGSVGLFKKCVVCLSRRPNVLLQPCKHLIHARCFYPWPISTCPLCKNPISAVEACDIETYYHNGEAYVPPQNISSIVLQRSGRWSSEETAYAKLLMDGFSGGMLPVGDKTNLGGFLCQMLLCNSARLSSKLRTGKKIFVPKKVNNVLPGEIENYMLLQKRISDAEDLFLFYVAKTGEVEEAAALSHNIQYQWMRQFVQHAWATQQSISSTSSLPHGGVTSAHRMLSSVSFPASGNEDTGVNVGDNNPHNSHMSSPALSFSGGTSVLGRAAFDQGSGQTTMTYDMPSSVNGGPNHALALFSQPSPQQLPMTQMHYQNSPHASMAFESSVPSYVFGVTQPASSMQQRVATQQQRSSQLVSQTQNHSFAAYSSLGHMKPPELPPKTVVGQGGRAGGAYDDGECFREMMQFARAVGPEAEDRSPNTSLRLAMRAVREVLGMFPGTCTVAASRQTEEVFFASSGLVSGLGTRINRMQDLGVPFCDARELLNAFVENRDLAGVRLAGSTSTCVAFSHEVRGLRFRPNASQISSLASFIYACTVRVCFCGDLILAVLTFDPPLPDQMDRALTNGIASGPCLPVRPTAFLGNGLVGAREQTAQSGASSDQSSQGNVFSTGSSTFLANTMPQSSPYIDAQPSTNNPFPSRSTILSSSQEQTPSAVNKRDLQPFSGFPLSTGGLGSDTASRKRGLEDLEGSSLGPAQNLFVLSHSSNNNNTTEPFPVPAPLPAQLKRKISGGNGAAGDILFANRDSISVESESYFSNLLSSHFPEAASGINLPAAVDAGDADFMTGDSKNGNASYTSALFKEEKAEQRETGTNIRGDDDDIIEVGDIKSDNQPSSSVTTLFGYTAYEDLSRPVPSSQLSLQQSSGLDWMDDENAEFPQELEESNMVTTSTSTSLVSAPSTQDSFSHILGRFLRQVPFHLADVWVPVTLSPNCNVLVLGGSAYLDEKLLRWGSYSQNFYFKPSVGIPGRVLSRSQPEAQADVSALTRQTFPRVEGARTFGLHATLGLPVRSSDGGRMVVVFYSKDSFTPSEELVSFTENLLSKWNFKANVTLLGDHSPDVNIE